MKKNICIIGLVLTLIILVFVLINNTKSNYQTTEITSSIKLDSAKPTNMNKVIFIGDSYSLLEDQDTWVDVLVKKLELSNNEYLLKGEFSTGFTSYNIETKDKFIDLLKQAYKEEKQPENVTHIIVCGGANDFTTSQEILENDIKEFIKYANKKFPQAKVYVGSIGYCVDPLYKNEFANVYAAYSNCIKYGAIYLNGSENIAHDYRYFSGTTIDTVHPNQDGANAIGNGIYQCLMTGSCKTYKSWELNEDDQGWNVYYSMQNDSTLFFKQTDTVIKAVDMNDDNTIELCTFNPTVVGGDSNNNTKYPVQVSLLLDDNTTIRANAYIQLSSKSVDTIIYQTINLCIDTYENVKAIFVEPFTLTLDISDC